jgi:hypothetical protein
VTGDATLEKATTALNVTAGSEGGLSSGKTVKLNSVPKVTADKKLLLPKKICQRNCHS